MICRLLHRLAACFRAPTRRPVAWLPAGTRESLDVLREVAEGIVGSLGTGEEEMLAWATAAVDALEDLAIEQTFPREMVTVSPRARAALFDLLRAAPDDPIAELVVGHEQADDELRRLIRHVGPGVVARLTSRRAREAEQHAIGGALRDWRAAIAAHLSEPGLEAPARVLIDDVPRLRDQITVGRAS